MRHLPLALAVFLLLPLFAVPQGQGEPLLMTNDLADDVVDKIWNRLIEKVEGAVRWVADGIVSVFNYILDFVNAIFDTALDLSGFNDSPTMSVILTVIITLVLLGLVRVWVLLLDVLPIA